MSAQADPWSRLVATPARFAFDAAVAVVLRQRRRRRVADAMTLRATHSLAYPAADVLEVKESTQKPALLVGIPGLAGAGGVLPWHYAGLVARAGAKGLADLLHLIAGGMLAALAEAGIKYRLDRAVEVARLAEPAEPAQHEMALLAVTGFAGVDLDRLLPLARDPILYYAGLFAQRPATAAGLAALASDWLGHPVEVVEFAGDWLTIAEEQQTQLPCRRHPGVFNRLGQGAAIGGRVFDPQSGFILRLGPLRRAAFHALLPGGAALASLAALVRAYVGLGIRFAVQPVLAAADIAPLRLARAERPGALLGYTTWCGADVAGRTRDGDEALFRPRSPR